MSDINHPDSQQAAANAKLRGFISESAEQRHSMDALKRANIEINKLRQQVEELEKQNALIDDECDKVWKDSEGHYYVGGSVMGDVKVNVWQACEHRR